MFGTFLGNNQSAQKIREEDFWEICPQSVSCFFLQNILQKYENCFGQEDIIDSLRDLFERMLWVISCQICVWHNFGGHVSKGGFTNSSRRYVSQVARAIPGA